MIDLRSDTVTVPTQEMREVMAKAIVDDDVFGCDPSVNELQDYAAELLGKEAALFVPSGTMGNQISLAIQAEAATEVIAESEAHIFYYETGAPSIISRCQLRCLESEKGMIPLEKIKAAVRTSEYWFPLTKGICLENTHNRHGGTVIDLDYIKEVRKFADEQGLFMHCDGARLWNACAATDISPKDYAAPFDTVSVCLSKALGAPVGSLIASTKEKIDKARIWRKILGGGMRQAGVLAAPALYAIKKHFPLLKKDHENAKEFAKIIAESEFIDVDFNSIETNMVFFKYPESLQQGKLQKACAEEGLAIIEVGNHTVRAVFHFQVSHEQMLSAADIIKHSTKNLV